MKKTMYVLATAFAILWASDAAAQFNKKDVLLNLGAGLNSYYAAGFPLHGSIEVGVTDEVGVGASFDFVGSRYRSGGTYYPFVAMYIGGRGTFHMSELLQLNTPELDLYAGVAVGLRTFAWTDNSVGGLGSIYGNGIYYGIFAGGRYYFDKSFGVFGELGAGYSGNARFGITIRF